MPKMTSIFAGTTGIALVMVAYFWYELSIERDLNRQMYSHVTHLEKERGRIRQVPPGLPGAVVSAQVPDSVVADVSKQNVAMSAEPAATFATVSANQATSINMRELFKDPKFQEAQHTQIRLQMPQNYPDVAKELGLSPAKAEALFDLLAKQQMKRMMLTAVSAGNTDDIGVKSQRDLDDLVRKGQADVVDFLGPARSQVWREYQKNLGARKQVNQLRTTLLAAGYPLTDAQASPLLATFTAEQQRMNDQDRYRTYSRDPRAQIKYEDDNLKAMEEFNERILDAVQSYLEPRQLSALKSSMVQRLAMSRAITKARRAQLEGGVGNSALAP